MDRGDLEGEIGRLHRMSYAWALGCCGRVREDAEDVLQASYLKILDGSARFRGDSSFKTFLYGVIRRTASEHRRREWLRRLFLSSFSRADAVAAPEIEAGDPTAPQLETALAKLARRQREALDLVFGHDMTIEEAARTMGISVGSARVHYERGKKRLRQELGGERP